MEKLTKIIESQQIIENVLVCEWSEESAMNVRGSKALELYAIAECIGNCRNYEQVKNFIQKSVKQN